jgi:hypothetical protein
MPLTRMVVNAPVKFDTALRMALDELLMAL